MLPKELPFSFSAGLAAARRQQWGPTTWYFASRSEDMAIMLPAAVAPGPHQALTHQIHATVLKVKQRGEGNGLIASHKLINDPLFFVSFSFNF